MIINNQNGSAVWESLSLISLLIIIISGVLLVAYLIFAKAFVNYQAEQTLYCVSERGSLSSCRRQLIRQVDRYLPWGKVHVHKLSARTNGAQIRARWQFQKLHIEVQRELTVSSQSGFSH